MGEEDTEISCQAWTTKLPKASQPNLNFMGRLIQISLNLQFFLDVNFLYPFDILTKRKPRKPLYPFDINIFLSAPEILHKGRCASAGDMYSLGMVFTACFNGGQAVIQASHSTSNYFKLAGQVREYRDTISLEKGFHGVLASLITNIPVQSFVYDSAWLRC